MQWAITFNATKTIQQTFTHNHKHQPPSLTFGGEPIPIKDSHTHLGITFSTDLHFHHHINKVCDKINKTLSPLYPLAKYIPKSVLDQVYKTYIRPHFDYADIIYDGHITAQDATRLETLQNRAARLVTGGLFRTSTNKLMAELGWERLHTRRKIHRLSFYHQLNTTQHQPQYIRVAMPNTRSQDTNRHLRNANKHTTVANRTTAFNKSFFPTTTKQWNELPHATRQLTHKQFKKQLRQQLGEPDPSPYCSFGSKQGNIFHARLRMEMTQLNAHQHICQKVPSPECSCGHKNENIKHFTLNCPIYNNQRIKLFDRLSETLQIHFRRLTPTNQLNILLHGMNLSSASGREVALHFQNFLFETKRFGSLRAAPSPGMRLWVHIPLDILFNCTVAAVTVITFTVF